jgi:hypothetical protein
MPIIAVVNRRTAGDLRSGRGVGGRARRYRHRCGGTGGISINAGRSDSVRLRGLKRPRHYCSSRGGRWLPGFVAAPLGVTVGAHLQSLRQSAEFP